MVYFASSLIARPNFDAKKGYLTFSLVDDCRIISRILIGIPRERVCLLHTLEIMKKNAKPAGFFQQKKNYSTFFLTDADDRGISLEFQVNDIVYYIINPAKKNRKPSFLTKRVLKFFF